MPNLVVSTRNKHGFTLTELLMVVLIFGTISALGLPVLLGPKRDFNEQNAVLSLEILRSSRACWEQEGNSPPPLFALSGLVERSASGPIRQLTPSSFRYLGKGGGGVISAGYLLAERTSPSGSAVGVLASPTSPAYSGNRFYWLDYGAATISEVIDLGAVGESGPPQASGLSALK